jgi:hypothetical protein
LRAIAANDEHAVLRDLRVAGFMTSGVLLRGAGLVPRASEARLHLVGEDGEAFSMDVPALPPATRGVQVSAAALTPLARTRPEQGFWCESLKQQKTVYCSFRRYDDLAARVRDMVDMIEREQPAKLAIDMRENGGGDYTKGEEYLIGAVRRLGAINRPGRLFVLIGPKTFSAAMNNAAQFADQTEAILVGRPIGEKPNSYQEPREFRLPNSKLKVRYSTRFYRFSNGAENMIRPDQDISTTWEDFRAGRDPALEWILAYAPT